MTINHEMYEQVQTIFYLLSTQQNYPIAVSIATSVLLYITYLRICHCAIRNVIFFRTVALFLFLPEGHITTEPVEAPVDQLFPISERLVNDVERTLGRIVQDAINESLSKFPSLKQAVEVKVVNKIFEKKREQTIGFIRQFLDMQKMSNDVVFAPVPLPSEINTWEVVTVTNTGRDRTYHPCMVSPTMKQMKHLAKKLYPDNIIQEIEDGSVALNHYKVSLFKSCGTLW